MTLAGLCLLLQAWIVWLIPAGNISNILALFCSIGAIFAAVKYCVRCAHTAVLGLTGLVIFGGVSGAALLILCLGAAFAGPHHHTDYLTLSLNIGLIVAICTMALISLSLSPARRIAIIAGLVSCVVIGRGFATLFPNPEYASGDYISNIAFYRVLILPLLIGAFVGLDLAFIAERCPDLPRRPAAWAALLLAVFLGAGYRLHDAGSGTYRTYCSSELAAMGKADLLIRRLNGARREADKLAAMYELGGVRNGQVAVVMASMLKDHHASVRSEAAEYLVNNPSREVIKILISTIHNSDPEARQYAMLALSRLKSEDTYQVLIRSLNDLATRDGAILALADLGDKRATPHLVSLISADDPPLTSGIIRALRDIGDPRAVPALVAVIQGIDMDLWKDAAMAAVQMGGQEPVTRALLGHFRDFDPVSRAKSAELLGELGNESALPLLRNLARSDRDKSVALVATRAAQKLQYTVSTRPHRRPTTPVAAAFPD